MARRFDSPAFGWGSDGELGGARGFDAAEGTPLCPEPVEGAGHLPLKGGDRLVAFSLPDNSGGFLATFNVKWPASPLLISPLEGEMPGRAEGGTGPASYTVNRTLISEVITAEYAGTLA